MAKKKNDIDELDKYLKIYEQSVEELAINVLTETQILYESVIQDFYDDYSPIWYNRTGYSMYGSSGSENLYTDENIHPMDNGWETVINVGAQYIPGNPYGGNSTKSKNKSWIFYRTFVKGIHGINVPPKSFGKPYSRTFKRIYGKLKLQRWNTQLKPYKTKKGWVVRKKVLATQKFYDIKRIKFSTMTNMVPAPLTLMKKGFKEINRHKKLKQEFNEILKKNISSAK